MDLMTAAPVDLHSLAPCDSLYVSPHHDDVLLSCGARLLAEARRRPQRLPLRGAARGLRAGSGARPPRSARSAASSRRRARGRPRAARPVPVALPRGALAPRRPQGLAGALALDRARRAPVAAG